jgi:5-methylcytosine-specific restriction endonuclease McrA
VRLPDFADDRELEAQVTQEILLDDFGGDFGEHAAEAMALAHYRCTQCGIDLSAEKLRRFLHVHHKDVVKFDNPLAQLVVLCIGCHANQPGHDLMRALLDFSEFSVLARG